MIKTSYRDLSARKLSLQGFLYIKSGLKQNYKIKLRGLNAKRNDKDLYIKNLGWPGAKI
jgi:plasmid maintenance system killer protein